MKFMEEMKEDRRKHKRVKTSHLVTITRVTAEGEARETVGRTVDLSPGGILLEMIECLEPGDQVGVSMALEEEVIEVSGFVCRVSPLEEELFETAISFHSFPADTADRLFSFWKKLMKEDH